MTWPPENDEDMRLATRKAAFFVLNVFKRIANEQHEPLRVACPPEAAVALIEMVLAGKVCETYAKMEARNYFKWWRELVRNA